MCEGNEEEFQKMFWSKTSSLYVLKTPKFMINLKKDSRLEPPWRSLDLDLSAKLIHGLS